MCLPHDLREPGIGTPERAEHLKADLRMLLDNLALAVGQPLRLQDQRLGNCKDPDIVDQAGQGQSLQLLPLKLQSHPKLGGQDGNID